MLAARSRRTDRRQHAPVSASAQPLRRWRLGSRADLVAADVASLPFADESFVLVVSTFGADSEGKLVYFMSIDGVRFRRPVLPGDRLELHVQKVQARANVWKFSGKAMVEGKVAAEATFAANVSRFSIAIACFSMAASARDRQGELLELSPDRRACDFVNDLQRLRDPLLKLIFVH